MKTFKIYEAGKGFYNLEITDDNNHYNIDELTLAQLDKMIEFLSDLHFVETIDEWDIFDPFTLMEDDKEDKNE